MMRPTRVVVVGVAMTNVSVLLAESATKYPDAHALVHGDTTITYAALASDVARFADYLIYGGLQPGDRVGVMLPNTPEFAVVFYGVLHAGGVVVPLNPELHARSVQFYLTITDATMLFVAARHGVAAAVAAVTAGAQPVEVTRHGIAYLTAGFPGRSEPARRASWDVAVVLPAAETVGPHTVALTHAELIGSKAVTAGVLLSLNRNDVVVGCLPMSERSGMTCALLAALSAGSTLVLPEFDPVFDPATTLEMIAAERITVLEGAPAMYLALLDAAHHNDGDYSSLRVCVSAGRPLPVDVLRRFQDRFSCVVVDADELLGASASASLR
jgi:long-chain acyl-CoA synthetase